MSSSEDIISIFWKWSDCAPWASAVVSGFLFKVIYPAKNIKCEESEFGEKNGKKNQQATTATNKENQHSKTF